MAQHSIFSPSSLSRVMSCPASFGQTQRVPKEKSSIYAQRGTLLHHAFTFVWEHYVSGDAAKADAVFSNLKIEPEDAQYVLSCCDYVKAQLLTCGPSATIELEARVTMASWGLPDVWGTADVIIKDPDNRRMIVDDHKFGQGVPVYAQDNTQLLCYLAGAAGFPQEYDSYIVAIIQPPLDIYSSAEVTPSELEAFTGLISRGIQTARRADAPYNPSEEACRFCPARSSCRARYDQAVGEAQEVFAIAKKMPDITNDEKAYLAKLLTNIEQIKKALFADIQTTIMNGQSVPGWKLVAGRSIRKWSDEGVAMKWLLQNKIFDDSEDLFDKTFKSPSKVEKLNRAMKKDENFAKLITKPVGKPQLVKESDKRPDYDINATADAVFKKV